MAVTTERSAGATAIRPFRAEIPQKEVEDLRRRIAATGWPEKETVDDGSQGTPLAKLRNSFATGGPTTTAGGSKRG